MNGNHLRKIRNPRSVLDLATGTGAWAVDIAQEFATADEVVGVDIKSTAPKRYPPNCRFEVRITPPLLLILDWGCAQGNPISRELFLICPLTVIEDGSDGLAELYRRYISCNSAWRLRSVH
jgi:hypothetical protein